MKKTNQILAGLLAALWLCLSAVLWLGPRRELSEAERRKLEAFPPLSLQTVLDGRFMTKLETFFQDQFPLRLETCSILTRSFFRQVANSGYV